MSDPKTDRPGRNEPCHCGSGKKYKRCCLAKDHEVEREESSRLAAESSDQPKAAPPEAAKPPRPTEQPWKRGADNYKSFQRFMTPRKRGDS